MFDIDGVLADVRHRLPYLARQPKDWDAFFAAAPADPPLAEGIALAVQANRDCEVSYVTGRPERCRADTEAWLDRHGLPRGRLLMRGSRDHRPARVAKVELLAELATEGVVAIVVDDDPAVCDAYERAGWTVLRATWADRAPALEQAQEDDGRT